MQTSDPLRVAWRTAGRPLLKVHWRDAAVCDRCAVPADVTVRLADVISDKFTGWDDYARAGRHPVWCPACAWGHSDTSLRQVPWVITRDLARQATANDLAEALSAPLTPATAVIVPLSRKKHLLPAAQWGVLTTDDARLPWHRREVESLAALQTLRRYGFNEQALTEQTPRFDVLRTLVPAQQVEAMHLWVRLEGWRKTGMLMQVGLKATRLDPAA